MSGPVIEVLLATWNGERFLRQQIESIMGQTYPEVRVLARDDGSSDGTVAILEEYARRFPERFRILPFDGATGSPKWNFMRLMQASSAPYVAFADQDDVWLAEKLQHEMAVMRGAEAALPQKTPVLVYTDLELIDVEGVRTSESFWRAQGIPGGERRFARLLAQNVFTGCTGLLNQALVKKSLPIPEKANMHDWWVMLVAAAFGRLVALPEATVQYRQHATNAVGAVAPPRRKLTANLREHGERAKEWEMTERNAEAFLEQFGEALPAEALRLTRAYVRAGKHENRVVRVATVVRNGFYRMSARMNLAMLWFLWNRRSWLQSTDRK